LFVPASEILLRLLLHFFFALPEHAVVQEEASERIHHHKVAFLDFLLSKTILLEKITISSKYPNSLVKHKYIYFNFLIVCE
jgi:hypothetical protein